MAIFPGAVATDANLYIAVNALVTLLADNPLTIGATTVTVSSTSGFPTTGAISIDSEVIHYTGLGGGGTTFTGCSRGFDGTAASSHTQNSQVKLNEIADHHNVLKDEIKAIEQNLSDRIGLSASVVDIPNTDLKIGGNVLLPILQIIQTSTTTPFSTTSTSFVNSNLAVTITPKFSTSKILIIATGSANADGGEQFEGTLARGASNLLAADGGTRVDSGKAPMTLMWYDSPATTSATTYNFQVRAVNGIGGQFPVTGTATIIAIEIAQ